MLKNRKLIALLLCLLLATSVAMAGCQGQETPTTVGPCTEHTDIDKDGMCDNCGIQVGLVVPTTKPGPKEVEVTFEVLNEEGQPMTGVTVHVKDGYNEVDVTTTVGSDGRCTLTLPRESYMATVEDLPIYHLAGFHRFDAIEGVELIKITVYNNTPTGEMSKPFFVGTQPVTKSFEPGQQLYFTLRGGEGRIVIIRNPDVEVAYAGEIYTPDENGRLELYIVTEDPKDAVLLGVTNKSASAQDIEVDAYANPGTVDNPHEAELDKTTVVKVHGSSSIYYEWIATADGSVTVTSASEVNSISLTNTKNGDDSQITGTQMAGPTNGAASVTLGGVKKGDIIRIQVSVTQDDVETEYEIDFTLSFAAN